MTDRADTKIETKTIRYLVNSVDDLREIADTVRFIIQQNANISDSAEIIANVPISVIPIGESSGFILSFEVPADLLEKASRNKKERSEINARLKYDTGEIPTPEIKTSGSWSQFAFKIDTLKDLILAVHSTMNLYQSAAERLEYVNLKRRTVMKAKPAEGSGIQLFFQVPGILS
jgi:hypothetical protein